jgi:hypothetical protein
VTTLLIAFCISLAIVAIVGMTIVFLIMRNMLLEVSEAVSDMSSAITSLIQLLKTKEV